MRTFKMPSASLVAALAAFVLASQAVAAPAATPTVAVAPQYDTTHVYVAPEDFDRFVTSLVATFGGTATQAERRQVTPTPSTTKSQLVQTPVGTVSVFGFKTPIPYPFGAERTGYLVTNLDAAVDRRPGTRRGRPGRLRSPIRSAATRSCNGRAASTCNSTGTRPRQVRRCQTVPENRVYVSAEQAEAFIRRLLAFSQGKVVSDMRERARRARSASPARPFAASASSLGFGKVTVLVTDGQLPFPYGRETTGYEVADLDADAGQGQGGGRRAFWSSRTPSRGRATAMVQFPGGYIAEIHSASGP